MKAYYNMVLFRSRTGMKLLEKSKKIAEKMENKMIYKWATQCEKVYDVKFISSDHFMVNTQSEKYLGPDSAPKSLTRWTFFKDYFSGDILSAYSSQLGIRLFWSYTSTLAKKVINIFLLPTAIFHMYFRIFGQKSVRNWLFVINWRIITLKMMVQYNYLKKRPSWKKIGKSWKKNSENFGKQILRKKWSKKIWKKNVEKKFWKKMLKKNFGKKFCETNFEKKMVKKNFGKIWKQNFESFEKNSWETNFGKKFWKKILKKNFGKKFWKKISEKNVGKEILKKKIWKRNFEKKIWKRNFEKKNLEKNFWKKKIWKRNFEKKNLAKTFWTNRFS